MNPNNPSAFQPFFMVPPGYYPSQPGPVQREEVPARVIAAMKVLEQLSIKTMTRGMANDVGFDTIPGQTLSPIEEKVQNYAGDLLCQYFKGNMKPDIWEERSLQNATPYMEDQIVGGKVMNCACTNPGANVPTPYCKLCNRSGKVIVYPAKPSADTTEGF